MSASIVRADTMWSTDPIRLRLRELRNARGLSLTGASARSGIPAVVIGSYERGDRTPTAGRLQKLLAIYGYALAVVAAGESVHPTYADELRALADRIESGQVAA
jgi:transcriptional regulator with XRE-family HTH domain